MIKFVHAKINLGLRVLRKRPDGYHDISTVFYPVGLHAGSASDPGRLADVLEITPSDADSLHVGGMPLDCAPGDNLVWRALCLYRDMYPDLPPVDIRLDKHLPSQAGLGGGSADASFTLLALDEMCGHPLGQERLLAAALRLGADCPFFIIGSPCLASGVGEVLSPMSLDLSGYWIAVVKPEASISTAQAFRGIVPSEHGLSVAEAISRPVGEWRSLLVNDFETSAFAIYPEFRDIKQGLYDSGALYASMSGSGSAFYGLFDSREQALRAAESSGLPYATVARL